MDELSLLNCCLGECFFVRVDPKTFELSLQCFILLDLYIFLDLCRKPDFRMPLHRDETLMCALADNTVYPSTSMLRYFIFLASIKLEGAVYISSFVVLSKAIPQTFPKGEYRNPSQARARIISSQRTQSRLSRPPTMEKPCRRHNQCRWTDSHTCVFTLFKFYLCRRQE